MVTSWQSHRQLQHCSCVHDLRGVSPHCKHTQPPCTWPATLYHDAVVAPTHHLQHQQLYRGRCSNRHRCSDTICRAAPAIRPETVAVVEYLLLLQAQPGSDPEDMEVLLDSLWSLQYMVPSIMYASAGNIIACTLCSKQDVQQQQQQQLQQELVAASAAADPVPQQQQEQQLVAGMFTHAVHYRLSSRSALESLLLHPMMAALQDRISCDCAASAQLVFEGAVAKRLDALFRRGDEYASGVEHILLLQPGHRGGAGADEFLERLAALAESSVAGGIQASYGAVISCAHTAATHVLMTRFAAAQQVQQLLATPACAAVMARDPRVPVVAASSLWIGIQATEESTKVDGTGSLQQK